MNKKSIQVKIFFFLFLFLLCSTAGGTDYTTSISGTANIDDTHMSSSATNTNYGTNTTITVRDINNALIKLNDLSTLLPANATIIADTLFLYCTTNTTDGDISVYRVFKSWTETGATWNSWVTPDYQWATAGCLCAGDGGTDNSIDAGTCADSNRDTKATAMSTVTVTTAATWYAWDIDTATANGWYRGTIAENGILLKYISGRNTFASSEYITNPALVPYFKFTYIVHNPVLAIPGYEGITEGEELTFRISATDIDGDSIILSVISASKPYNAVFVDSFNGAGSFTFTPTASQSESVYNVAFIASDGVLADTEITQVEVIDKFVSILRPAVDKGKNAYWKLNPTHTTDSAWWNINEIISDGDTTYLWSAHGGKIGYGWASNAWTTSYDIDSVTLHWLVKETGSGGVITIGREIYWIELGWLVCANYTDSDTAMFTLTTSYVDYSITWGAIEPCEGQPWSAPYFDPAIDIQWWIESTTVPAGDTILVTKSYVVVYSHSEEVSPVTGAQIIRVNDEW